MLAADSGTGWIFALRRGALSVWSQDPLLRAVNELVPQGGRLLAIDVATQRITVLADRLGGGDGLAAAGRDDDYVSEWPGRLYRVTPGGAVVTVMDVSKADTYINDVIRVGDRLVVPHWKPGKLTAYKLPR